MVRSNTFRRRSSLWLGLLFFSLSTVARATSFLDPIHESLDERQLRAVIQGEKETAARLMASLFLAERLSLELRLHEIALVRESLATRCEALVVADFAGWERSERRLGLFTCAIASAENVEGSDPFSRTGHIKQALERYERASREEEAAGSGAPSLDAALEGGRTVPPQAERFYAEGRVFLALPSLPGVTPNRGLLALQFLHRLVPDRKSPLYFLAKGYERIGNLSAAETWVRKALEVREVRAEIDFERPRRLQRARRDGLGYGFAPAVIFTPNGGVGFYGTYADDRLGDRDRAGKIGASVTTRGQWGAEASYQDYELLAPMGVKARVDIFRGEQDAFDLGPDAPVSSRFIPKVGRESGRLGVVQPVWGAMEAELGWGWFHQTARFDRPIAFPDFEAVYFSGPYFELRYDSRDSESFPAEGVLARLGGQFPTRGLLSPRTFERWSVQTSGYLRGWGRGQVGALHLAAFGASGEEAPWASFPRLGAPLKAVREGRLQDRALVEAMAEYRLPIDYGFGVIGFVQTASVRDGVGAALTGRYAWGGGGGLFWLTDTRRSQTWQLLISHFAEETLFFATGALSL